MKNFTINKTKLKVKTDKINKKFLVQSGIRNYQVNSDVSLSYVKKCLKIKKIFF